MFLPHLLPKVMLPKIKRLLKLQSAVKFLHLIYLLSFILFLTYPWSFTNKVVNHAVMFEFVFSFLILAMQIIFYLDTKF